MRIKILKKITVQHSVTGWGRKHWCLLTETRVGLDSWNNQCNNWVKISDFKSNIPRKDQACQRIQHRRKAHNSICLLQAHSCSFLARQWPNDTSTVLCDFSDISIITFKPIWHSLLDKDKRENMPMRSPYTKILSLQHHKDSSTHQHAEVRTWHPNLTSFHVWTSSITELVRCA